jgi:hypothetical protein
MKVLQDIPKELRDPTPWYDIHCGWVEVCWITSLNIRYLRYYWSSPCCCNCNDVTFSTAGSTDKDVNFGCALRTRACADEISARILSSNDWATSFVTIPICRSQIFTQPW